MHAPIRRKLLLINLWLIVGLSAVGVMLAWGIRNLRDDATSAASEYAELRLVESAMYHVAQVRLSLSHDVPASAEAHLHIEEALKNLRAFEEFQTTEADANAEAGHQQEERRAASGAISALTTLQEQLHAATVADAARGRQGSERLISAALLGLSGIASETEIFGARKASAELTVNTLIIVGSLAALLVIGSIIATIVCYQSVMSPLRRLHAGVRRLATGELSSRLPQEQSREFSELTSDFNRMASELQSLYNDLEAKVHQKSRELVKSERLASVGFLAAGVAHEINNPLGIMSGYAELAERWVNDPSPKNLAEIRSALEIIRAEAFRCKGITERLLSLARIGDAARIDIALPELVTEVADMLRGLRKYHDRRLVLRFADSESLMVKANADELKQVMLNVLVNALEAAPPGAGEVVVSGARKNGTARVVIQDNGMGMSPEVLERAFEPFYSTKPASGNRGTGLGLAISHSIIEAHGGTLRAESEGRGRGSRFIIELPVSAERTANAH